MSDTPTQSESGSATIKLDLDRRLGEVDPRIYGGFVENLGRCIYGGVFDEGSPLSDERGFRRDVIEALRGLRPPVLRWGGNFISGYHWTDGVGPPSERPRRWDRAWKTEESNRFGTDEFIELCRMVGAEAHISVNMGTGTLDEAASWLEYCNGRGNTAWADARRRNGYPEPHGVRYWGLGNEVYGPWQIGALSAEEYVARARELAKLLRWTDPDIELISCGEDGWTDWDRTVIDGLSAFVDWHSLHIYTGSQDYYRNVLMPHQVERALDICQSFIDRARYVQRLDHSIHVAYDEWNQWFRHETVRGHEERYTLADALAVGAYLNAFVRRCRTVRMANLAQMVNAIAPIVTSSQGLFLQTIYHPLRLYAEHMHGTALDVHVSAPTYDLTGHEEGGNRHKVADLGPFSLLDVSAAYDRNHSVIVLGAVNRHPNRAIVADIVMAAGARTAAGRVFEVNGPDSGAANTFEQPGLVEVRERPLSPPDDQFCHVFPAHSITLLRLQLAQ